MSIDVDPRLIHEISEFLRSELGTDVAAAFIYGSVADGSAGPDSDIDCFTITSEPLSSPQGVSGYMRSGAWMPSRLSPRARTRAVRSHNNRRLWRVSPSARRTGQRS